MSKLFISGAFSGMAGALRGYIMQLFNQHNIEILYKSGNVQETAASMISRSDGVILLLGAHQGVIADVWGSKLVDQELAYAKYRRKPVIPILFSIDNSEKIPANVMAMRKQIQREYGGKHIEIKSIVDYIDEVKLENELNSLTSNSEKAKELKLAVNSICYPDWQNYAKLFSSNKIFISHSHADKDMALDIYNSLMQYDLIPWIDNYNIAAGQDLVSEIRHAIDKSGFIFVLLSENSIKSDWVKKEVYMALENETKYAEKAGNIIIPILLDDCTLPEELSFLQDRLYVKMDRDINLYEQGIRKLVSTILNYHRPTVY